MPKIIAWKCPHTSTLFEEEKPYRAHLRRLSRARIAQRKWQAIRDSVNGVIAGAQQVDNVQELVDYIIEHQRAFMIYGAFNDSCNSSKMHQALEEGWDITFPKIKSLTFKTTWRSEVSNSHNCPRDGYTNWGGQKKDGIRHYPGWHGNVEMEYSKDDYHITAKKPGARKSSKFEAAGISDMAASFGNSDSLCGICTGSGGGGTQSHRYGVSFFQSDFPNFDKQVTFAIVNSNGKNAIWGNGLQYDELDKLGCGSYSNDTVSH